MLRVILVQSLGKQEDSLAYRTKLNKLTTWETDILPDDERIEQTGHLRKIRKRSDIINQTNCMIDRHPCATLSHYTSPL